jgi:hypothetical protein
VTGDQAASDASSEERKLNVADELLYRQVHPQWIVEGEPSSQAFKPTKKDEGMLSIACGSETNAHSAFAHHTETLGLASGGTWALSVAEVGEVGLSAFAQPLSDNPAHGYIDFRGTGSSAAERKAKQLRVKARERGCMYQPPPHSQ